MQSYQWWQKTEQFLMSFFLPQLCIPLSTSITYCWQLNWSWSWNSFQIHFQIFLATLPPSFLGTVSTRRRSVRAVLCVRATYNFLEIRNRDLFWLKFSVNGTPSSLTLSSILSATFRFYAKKNYVQYFAYCMCCTLKIIWFCILILFDLI